MLMHDIICSNIRIAELKLKKIRLERNRLLENKPFILNKKKLQEWHTELIKLEEEESLILDELDIAYKELGKYI